MTLNVNYKEQIEDYCLELLSDREKLLFESELKLNAELKREVKFMKEIQSEIADKNIATLRNKLKKLASQSKTYNL